MRYLASLIFAFGLLAQPSVFLRSGAPAGGFVVTGASNGTPVVVQTYQPHGLNAGDTVVIWGVGATAGGNCIYSTANGIRQVKAVVDATHFSVTDQSGADIGANGPWCSGITSAGVVGSAAGGKVTGYTLTPQPRGWLDGPTGTTMRKLALGTNNGLTSLVIAGGVATATTSYSHGVSVGDKISVWGSGVSALNNSGNPYTVTAATGTTFQFKTTGIVDGTYSASNNTCGPSGTADCLRISQLAYNGNLWWDLGVNRWLKGWESGTGYKHVFDGGALGLGGGVEDISNQWAFAAVKSFVDPSDLAMRNIATYCANHIERAGGVSWSINEREANGGNYDLNDFASYALYGASMCYVAARDYLSPAEKHTFADKIYNDRDDPAATGCNAARPSASNEVVATGTAQGGTTTSITLSASDTQPDNYYVNNTVVYSAGGSTYYGLITSYASATKMATFYSAVGAGASAGTAYSINAGMKISTSASGATASVTGYNTHFTTDFAAEDAIVGANWWPGTGYGAQETSSYITAIQSDTSMTVVNSSSVMASPNYATMVWVLKQWQPGDCGLRWAQNHWQGAPSLPSLYSNGGIGNGYAGVSSSGVPGQMPLIGPNNLFSYMAGWLSIDLAVADDDPRAITRLAMDQQYWWDYGLNFALSYASGFDHSGSYYSFQREKGAVPSSIWNFVNSVQGFPMPDFSTWLYGDALQKMYGVYPDTRYNWGVAQNVAYPARYGTETADNGAYPGIGVGSNFQGTAVLQFLPSSTQARYFKHFLTNVTCCLYDAWNHLAGDAWTGILIDPRIQSVDHTQQPTQYLFQKTSSTGSCTLPEPNTVITCPSTFRTDAVISRTGWSSKTDTHAMFLSQTYWSDHDLPEGGSLRLYKVGHLLTSDTSPPGGATAQYTNSDVIDTMPMFTGGPTLNKGGQWNLIPATAYISRWASRNHGAWDPAYGDATSSYVYAMADLSGSYVTTYNRVQRHFVHFKKPGTEEILLQFDDIDLSNAPTQVEVHIHYGQNGETGAQLGGSETYNEGDTTCPGAGGCGSLDSTRLIVSLEDGGTTGKDPNRTFGVVSRFFSPSSITVRDDGSGYPGSSGHTHRVSLCGGSSCGATVGQLEAVTVHKVTASLVDTTLNAITLNTDANWVGLETTDAAGTGGKVALFARNGRTPILATFQTDHGGTGQYLIAGIQAGLTYRIYRQTDGFEVARIASAPGDNTLYFETTAGSYSIFPDRLSNLILRVAIPSAPAGKSFTYAFEADSSDTTFRWRISGGSLPLGVTLSPDGVLSGTPSLAGDYTFTVTAEEPDQLSLAASASFTWHVSPPQLDLMLQMITSSQAIIGYGGAGLDATQPCTMTVSPQSDFSVTAEQVTDNAGPARRVYVAGAVNALQPSTTYYLKADCGRWTSLPVSFATTAAAQGSATTIPLSLSPPAWLHASFVNVQYGNSPQLGNSLAVPCAGTCLAQIPASAGSIVYFKHVYLDSASHAIGSSSIRPVAAGR